MTFRITQLYPISISLRNSSDFSGLLVKSELLLWHHMMTNIILFCCICSDTKKDRCGMYPKKTLSAASLLSECERKRRRSLEARGCAKSESEFSMGTAATCPFIMSEQSPRTTKLFLSVYALSNDQALRQTEIFACNIC